MAEQTLTTKCINCSYCRFPRSADDNNGACKCQLMKYKTIDVYVSGDETPEWCPLKQSLQMS